jgi:CheY-like chemotaxis protein
MSKTLLLADDSVTIQKVVGISFASEDVSLVTVDNGDDAVARAREIKPDIVLADVVMPGKNGYEVCEALKGDPELRHIPVLLLTGTFEAFDEERARKVGAAAHVAKPFEAQSLVDEVKRLLAAPPPVAEPPPPPPAAEAPAPPPAPEVATPAPVSTPAGSPDDSFDFFDDDLGELPAAQAEPVEDDADDALELDQEAGFAFGEEELPAVPSPEPLASPPPPAAEPMAASPPRPPAGFGSPSPLSDPVEQTVAILPSDDDGIGAEPLVAPEPPPIPETPGAEMSESDLRTLDSEPEPLETAGDSASGGFDFEFEGAVPESRDNLVDPSDLAREAVVDPSGVSGFDISSSDLGSSMETDPVGPPPTVVHTEPAPPPADPTPPLASTAPRLDEARPAQIEADEPLHAEPLADDEPFEDEPLVADEIAEPPPPPVQAAPEPARSPAAPIEPEALEQLRERLHDTLEKVAWESFSEVTEKIVRQAVDRVEKIAWEVIPQMAETLVREEIRRMKGEE